MKKLLEIIAGIVLFSASPAAALFTNGGFETGNTDGWTVSGDNSVISSFTEQFENTTGWDSGIPYYGNYSFYFDDQRADLPEFTKVGENKSGSAGNIWYGSAVTDINLLGLGLGLDDMVRIDLFVRDCGHGGHGGLVFLDGFGTTRLPDEVPEPATLLLLSFGLVGLGGYRMITEKAI